MTLYGEPSVLVIGASGALGTQVIEEFINQSSSFSRVAVLSDSTKVSKFLHLKTSGIEIVVGSFLDGSVYRGFDTLISLVGFELLPKEQEIFTLAVKAGIKHFYASAFSSDLSQPVLRNLPYFGHKVANEDFLKEEILKPYAKDVRVTIMYTGIFLEWVVKGGFYGVDTDAHTARPYGRGDAKISVTTMREYVYNPWTLAIVE
jgi:hypothetical protein